MKTPREILLARHQATNPKLDEIRHAVISEQACSSAAPESVKISPSPVGSVRVGFFEKLWRELFWPCRRTWGGLAAAWLALLVFNHSQTQQTSSAIIAKSPAPAEEMRIAYREQRRVLEEIMGPQSPMPLAQPPRQPNLKPRSERSATVVV